MRFVLERVSGPDMEPVELSEMKRHLREFDDVTDRDTDISGLITAGREWVEDYTGRALVDQSWRLTIDQGNIGTVVTDTVSGAGCCCGPFFWVSGVGEIWLRKSPVLDITSMKTFDSDGVETTVDASTYELREGDSKWPRIVPLSGATWTNSSLRIVFRAGYCDLSGSPQDDMGVVPMRFKQAIKLWAQAYYDAGADMEKLLEAAKNLIRSERVEMGFA